MVISLSVKAFDLSLNKLFLILLNIKHQILLYDKSDKLNSPSN